MLLLLKSLLQSVRTDLTLFACPLSTFVTAASLSSLLIALSPLPSTVPGTQEIFSKHLLSELAALGQAGWPWPRLHSGDPGLYNQPVPPPLLTRHTCSGGKLLNLAGPPFSHPKMRIILKPPLRAGVRIRHDSLCRTSRSLPSVQ